MLSGDELDIPDQLEPRANADEDRVRDVPDENLFGPSEFELMTAMAKEEELRMMLKRMEEANAKKVRGVKRHYREIENAPKYRRPPMRHFHGNGLVRGSEKPATDDSATALVRLHDDMVKMMQPDYSRLFLEDKVRTLKALEFRDAIKTWNALQFCAMLKQQTINPKCLPFNPFEVLAHLNRGSNQILEYVELFLHYNPASITQLRAAVTQYCLPPLYVAWAYVDPKGTLEFIPPHDFLPGYVCRGEKLRLTAFQYLMATKRADTPTLFLAYGFPCHNPPVGESGIVYCEKEHTWLADTSNLRDILRKDMEARGYSQLPPS